MRGPSDQADGAQIHLGSVRGGFSVPEKEQRATRSGGGSAYGDPLGMVRDEVRDMVRYGRLWYCNRVQGMLGSHGISF